MGSKHHVSTPATDEAYERYRAAREQYAVAKYEYKAAKYALKAARMREQAGAGGGQQERRGRHGHHHDRHDKHDRHDRRGHGALGPVESRDSMDRSMERGKRRQVVLEVVATERIGEHFQRLTLGGPGFADFRDNHFTDKYVKILFVDPALGLEPPYDVQALRRDLPKHQRPVRRTYTVHSVDAEAGTVVIDFVLHGGAGVAGPWAARAAVGEKVAFAGPGGKYAPDAAADAHLLVGDESALPALSAALAELTAKAPAAVGRAVIEVGGPEDEWELSAPAGVEVTWLHRGGEYTPARSGLAAAVESIGREEWPDGRVHAFVHGEKTMVKRLRRHLTEDRGVDRRMLSLSSYWTHGTADD
ncbi:siderophore-interacting protein [Citricoccus sp. I39-566]|uniref:siderophore-interacting protein n=1 Tax=Citricoccus sp. I39-566 TaxID=3073268 RepID=UPI00286A4DB7|nr:siderophore-interacting protein [Citricoccus sp. I39-566]WMY78626.1 siderophore-interacting protein [Citricoccus sp. I39-566]